MQDKEFDLFREQMSDVQPIRQETTFHKSTSKITEAQLARKLAAEAEDEALDDHLSMEYVEPVNPTDTITYKKDGVQDGVYKKLRLGKYHSEATLNLQQMKAIDARRQLITFLKDCQRLKLRSITINHGMGLHSKPYPALLKSYINVWLKNLDSVLCFHTAPKPLGGYGATSVLLKKSDEAKHENRERHLSRRA